VDEEVEDANEGVVMRSTSPLYKLLNSPQSGTEEVEEEEEEAERFGGGGGTYGMFPPPSLPAAVKRPLSTAATSAAPINFPTFADPAAPAPSPMATFSPRARGGFGRAPPLKRSRGPLQQSSSSPPPLSSTLPGFTAPSLFAAQRRASSLPPLKSNSKGGAHY
jgi:hypothetical protein